MADRYYRKIKKSFDDVKYKLQFTAMELKLKNNETGISDNLEKIENNETDIASNLKEIEKNEKDILSNLNKIETNEKDISTKIDDLTKNNLTNEKNISSIKNITEKQIYNKKIYFESFSSINDNKKFFLDTRIDYVFHDNYYNIEINASYNYSDHEFENFNHVYKLYDDYMLFKEITLNHKDTYDKDSKLIIDNLKINTLRYPKILTLEIYLQNINYNNENIELYENNKSFIEIKCN